MSTDSDIIIKNHKKTFTSNLIIKKLNYLATDKIGEVDVIKHATNSKLKKNTILFENVIDLDVTSPTKKYKNIINAFKSLKKASNLITIYESRKNPYFNDRKKKEIINVINNRFINQDKQAPKFKMIFYIHLEEKFFVKKQFV